MKCIVCNHNYWSKYLNKLVICRRCGYIRAQDKYFKVDFNKIYNRKYYEQDDYLSYENEKSALQKNFSNRIQLIRKFKKNGKLLEIGCAYGYFLELSSKYYQSQGIDLNKINNNLVLKNKKIKVIYGDFLKSKFKPKSFDTICMFDVIEHLKNPKSFITKIHKLLKQDGILVIETGNIDSILPNIQKNKWRLIKPPLHLNYFSKKTISRFLNSNGFEIKQINNVSFYRTIAQTIHGIFMNKKIDKYLDPLFNFKFPLNTFDLMFIIAQKKPQLSGEKY